MSFKSILDDIGRGFKVVFTDATKVALAAEPIVDMAFPGISVLYNATVSAVSAAENAAIVAGAQNGTGTQKLAMVVSSIEGSFNSYALANGLTIPDQTVIENWINSVVAGLNSIPALNSVVATGVVASTAVTKQAIPGTIASQLVPQLNP